jgi:hypothetical protein
MAESLNATALDLAAILVSYAAVSERRGSRNIPERRKKCAAGNTHMKKAAAKFIFVSIVQKKES